MALTINNALRDYEAQRLLTESKSLTEKSLTRNNSARSKSDNSEDTANVKFNRNSALDAAARSTSDGLSKVETARDGLAKISEKVQALQGLAEKASDTTLSTEDRTDLVKEAKALQSSIKETIKTTRYSNESVLSNNSSASYQTGTNRAQKVTVTNSDLGKQLESNGLYDADFSTAENAANASKTLKSAASNVKQVDKRYAAAQKALQTAAQKQEQAGPERSSIAINDLTQTIKQRVRDALESASNTTPRSVAELLS